MEMIETKHDLLTKKYTVVLEEKEYSYNASLRWRMVEL